jgi:protein TonB
MAARIGRTVAIGLGACLLTIASAAAATQPADAPNCSGPGVTPPSAANNHSLAGSYPVLSVALGEEGRTLLAFTIKEDGSIGDIRVAQTSGSARLDEAAVDGAGGWRYRPATRDGKPFACTWLAVVNWQLQGNYDAEDSPFNVVQLTAADLPPEARGSGEHGETFILLTLCGSGCEERAVVLHSSGHPDLDKAAVEIALKRWKATAAQLSGKPVKSIIPLLMIWPRETGK